MIRSQPILLQAQDEEDRKYWLEAMDGKEPVSLCKLVSTTLTFTKVCPNFDNLCIFLHVAVKSQLVLLMISVMVFFNCVV